MKWEETVELCPAYKDKCDALCHEHQAELSYKAGYEQHKKEVEKTLTFIADVCAENYKEGMKTVVEWLEEYSHVGFRIDGVPVIKDHIIVPPRLWQSKLKEWGIER